MPTSKLLGIMSLVVAGFVTIAEFNYYTAHPYRAGVAPHIIGLGVAVALVALIHIIKPESK
jgi:hypothetical protein